MYKSASPLALRPFVVAIGGANMDVLARTPVPLAPHDSTPGEIQCASGGVARNVAENLARLEVDVRLISVVGDDVFGRRLREDTARAGVNVDAMHTLMGQRTASYVSMHGPDGEMVVAVNDMAILDCLTPALLQTHADLLRLADCIVVDCNLSANSLAWVLQKDTDAPVFVDAVSVAKCTRLTPLLTRIHTLKVNRLEAQALAGQAVQSVDDALVVCRQLHAMGARNVVLSLGQDGACWCDASGQIGHQTARAVQIVNTNGAGDAMTAGLVQAHLAGEPLGQAVEWASACAQITLCSALANAPTLSVSTVQSQLIPFLNHP